MKKQKRKSFTSDNRIHHPINGRTRCQKEKWEQKTNHPLNKTKREQRLTQQINSRQKVDGEREWGKKCKYGTMREKITVQWELMGENTTQWTADIKWPQRQPRHCENTCRKHDKAQESWTEIAMERKSDTTDWNRDRNSRCVRVKARLRTVRVFTESEQHFRPHFRWKKISSLFITNSRNTT